MRPHNSNAGVQICTSYGEEVVALMLLTCLKDETSRASNVCESQSIHDASATHAADSDTASRSINTSRFTYLQVIDKNGDAENARHETTG